MPGGPSAIAAAMRFRYAPASVHGCCESAWDARTDQFASLHGTLLAILREPYWGFV